LNRLEDCLIATRHDDTTKNWSHVDARFTQCPKTISLSILYYLQLDFGLSLTNDRNDCVMQRHWLLLSCGTVCSTRSMVERVLEQTTWSFRCVRLTVNRTQKSDLRTSEDNDSTIFWNVGGSKGLGEQW